MAENNSPAPLKTADGAYPALPKPDYPARFDGHGGEQSSDESYSAEQMRAYAAQAVAAQAAPAAEPLPLLVRDIARDIGISSIDACQALKGLGNFSVNSAVTADIARKLRECFPEATEDSSAGDLVEEKIADEMSREERMIVLQRDSDGTPTVWCDPEIADIVRALNSGGVKTVASCSGHGVKPGGVALADGRQLLLLESLEAFNSAMSAITQAEVRAEPVAEARVSQDAAGKKTVELELRYGDLPSGTHLLFTAPQTQPADALLLDYLQTTGSTVEIIPGPTGWNFRVGGLHTTVRSNLRSSIDAAMAAAQEGGNASAGKDGAA